MNYLAVDKRVADPAPWNQRDRAAAPAQSLILAEQCCQQLDILLAGLVDFLTAV